MICGIILGTLICDKLLGDSARFPKKNLEIGLSLDFAKKKSSEDAKIFRDCLDYCLLL